MVNSYLPKVNSYPSKKKRGRVEHDRGGGGGGGGLVSLGPYKPFRTLKHHKQVPYAEVFRIASFNDQINTVLLSAISRDFGKPVKKNPTYILRPVRLRLGEFSEGSDETA